MKKTILLLFISWWLCAIYSQTNKPNVFATSGGKGTSGNMTINWTIGEPISKTFTNGTTTLTNGFQQGTLKITAIDEIKSKTVLTVYPNPTQDKLIIKSIQTENMKMKYDLYSLEGRYISTTNITNTEQIVDLMPFSKGTYILKIYSDTKMVSSYQIIKL